MINKGMNMYVEGRARGYEDACDDILQMLIKNPDYHTIDGLKTTLTIIEDIQKLKKTKTN